MLGLIITLVVLFVCYQMYVSVIQKKNKVMEAFSSIDVQLKKRYDLIPNILTLANKFMEHEKGLFEEVTKLRTKAMSLPNDVNNIGQKLQLDSQIKSLMGQVMVAVENYPQLKSDQTMVTAMQTYNEVEEHIAAARRFYNSAVLELNNAVEIFPSSVIAAACGIKKQEFFQADETARQSVNASDYLK
jgi:LemA protein